VKAVDQPGLPGINCRPLPVRAKSAWDAARIERFVAEMRIPIRIAVSNDGGPVICSLWFTYADGAFYCATRPDAWIVRCLRADPRAGFEIAVNEMPYRGVRGQANVRLDPEYGAALLGLLIDRYLGRRDLPLARWLLGRADDEVMLMLVPDWITAWDYSQRM